MISMTKLERLDRWTEVGGQRVSCVQQCVQLQASLCKESKNNKFRHEKKKPSGFFFADVLNYRTVPAELQ